METAYILLIDDDLTSRILVNEALSGKEIKIVHVQSGEEAIRLFRENPFFDLVITELMLHGMNGFDIIKEIRKSNPIVPVIALTAYVVEDMKARCIVEEFDDFLEKPVLVKEFIHRVEYLLHQVHI